MYWTLLIQNTQYPKCIKRKTNMKTIKNIITKVNATIDNYLPNLPNWFVWTIGLLVIYLILK